MRATAPRKRWPKRSTDMNALLMDVQTYLGKEECASGTGQRSNDVVALDAQTELRIEECALGMGQRSTAMNALLMDAPIEL